MSKKRLLNSNLDPLFPAVVQSVRPIPSPGGDILGVLDTINDRPFSRLDYIGDEVPVPSTEDEAGISSTKQEIELFFGPIPAGTTMNDLKNRYIKEGVTYLNHFTDIATPENILNIQDKAMGPNMSSYEVSSMFNYNSRKYNVYSEFTEENNLPPFWDLSVNAGDFIKFTNIISADTPDKPIVFPYVNRPATDFPYYNQIRISNPVTNEFSNELKRIGVSANFLATYISTTEKSLIPFYVQASTGPAMVEALPSFKVSNFLTSDTSDLEESLFDPDNPVSFGILSNILGGFAKTEFAMMLNSFSSNFRTYKEIVEQKTCYFEDYAYDIKKYRNQASGNPIQSFLSRADNDTTRLLDTQVKYGMTYVYETQGHYVILGNEYRYENVRIEPSESDANNPHRIRADVINRPSVIIVPIRLFGETITCAQPPPIPPKVHFVTETNSSREVEIYLSPVVGRLYDDFQIILPDDVSQLETMELIRPPTQVQAGYKFETFPESGLYEIFRMQSPPKEITDFANHKLNEIRMPYETPNATYTDYLIPNKKYYYMFRKVNAQEMVSNPTSIYEVELVVDADDSKVVVNDFRIPSKITSHKYKTFKSLFQIQPSVENIIFDNTQETLYGRTSFEGTLDDLTLGIAVKPVWSRKFKFRIRSTTSGKIIDYNITFKVSKDKTEEDF